MIESIHRAIKQVAQGREAVIMGLSSLPEWALDNLAFHFKNGGTVAEGPDAVLHCPGSA